MRFYNFDVYLRTLIGRIAGGMRKRNTAAMETTPLVQKDGVPTSPRSRNYNLKYLFLPFLATLLYAFLPSSLFSSSNDIVPSETSSYVICSPNSTKAIHTISRRDREQVVECVAVRGGAISYVGALADIRHVFELVGITNFDLRFLKEGEMMLPGLYVSLHSMRTAIS